MSIRAKLVIGDIDAESGQRTIGEIVATGGSVRSVLFLSLTDARIEKQCS